MTNVFIGLWLLLIILIAAAFLAYYFFPAAFPVFWRHRHVPNQGVINGIGSPPGASISQPQLRKLQATPKTTINQPNSSCS